MVERSQSPGSPTDRVGQEAFFVRLDEEALFFPPPDFPPLFFAPPDSLEDDALDSEELDFDEPGLDELDLDELDFFVPPEPDVEERDFD